MAGIEWLVEAFGCSPSALRDTAALRTLFDLIISDMGLKPVGEAVWHRFPHPGGVTGFWLLQESHLALHSFPEHGSVCLNLFCCRERSALDWETRLGVLLGASQVDVREFSRIYRLQPHQVGSRSLSGGTR